MLIKENAFFSLLAMKQWIVKQVMKKKMASSYKKSLSKRMRSAKLELSIASASTISGPFIELGSISPHKARGEPPLAQRQ